MKLQNRKELPLKYAELVEYADFFIGTENPLFFMDYYNDKPQQISERPARDSLYAYLGVSYDSIKNWPLKQIMALQYSKPFNQFTPFRNRLDAALDEAISLKAKDLPLEYWAQYGYALEKRVTLMRMWRGRNICGTDRTPDKRVYQLALAAANAADWEAFIKAHLYLINANRGWISEGTSNSDICQLFVRELEAVHIDPIKLLIGSVIQYDSLPKNRIKVDYVDIGIALADCKAKDTADQILIDAIGNKDLDLYNRIQLYFVSKSFYLRIFKSENNAEFIKRDAFLLGLLPKALHEQIKSSVRYRF